MRFEYWYSEQNQHFFRQPEKPDGVLIIVVQDGESFIPCLAEDTPIPCLSRVVNVDLTMPDGFDPELWEGISKSIKDLRRVCGDNHV